MEALMDKRFEELLLEYAQANTDKDRKQVEQTLWHEFGTVKAVFIMDMSGFSRLTQRFGVVHYLSMVKRMQLTAQPIVEQYGGEVIKFEADNCFALFPDSHSAVQAAITLNAAFFGMNIITPDEFDIRISIGIDYGDVLLIGGPDYFGATVNRASKLGEDIAGPGEILMTEEAFQKIPDGAGIKGKPMKFSISGIDLNVMKVEYQVKP
jgi:adenylate cyclase